MMYPCLLRYFFNSFYILTVQCSHSVMSDSLQPHGLQHARLPCPSPTPGGCSNSCPSSWWCHPTISSSAIPYSSNPSQHQSLFQWVSSSHQVARVLEFHLQHQSFQTTSFFSSFHIDAFGLWYWRRLLRVPWTARRSKQSILKEISPEYSLEGLMLKLQYFGHLMGRTDSFEKSLILGKFEGRRRRGREDEMVGWHHQLDGHEFEQVPGVGDG